MQRLLRRNPHLKPMRSCRYWPTHFQVCVLHMSNDFTHLGKIHWHNPTRLNLSRNSAPGVAPLGRDKAGLADVDGGLPWVLEHLLSADPGLLGADEGLRGSAIVDKQGNLVPDSHFIFSTLPDSSLLAEGEACSSPDCTVDIEHAWELDMTVMQQFTISWMFQTPA